MHPRRNCAAAVGQVAAWTSTHGIELIALADDVARLSLAGVTGVAREEFIASAEAVIALGGDGTLLGAMRLVADRPVPVLGVNFGHLGFLAEVERGELADALEALAAGRISTESRSCLVVRRGDDEHLAFNDAVLARVPGAGLVQATLAV